MKKKLIGLGLLAMMFAILGVTSCAPPHQMPPPPGVPIRQ